MRRWSIPKRALDLAIELPLVQRSFELAHRSSENDIRERTAAGLAAARERGKVGGRPAALTPAKKREATRMRNQGSTVGDIADVLGVSKRTLYRHFSARAS